MNRVKKCGGRDVYDCTRRVMLKLCTERFLRQFSKRGQRNNKNGFMVTCLHQVVVDAVLSHFPKKSELDVEDAIGRVLVNLTKTDPQKKREGTSGSQVVHSYSFCN